MVGNIIPFISGEEAKSEKEPLKVFGHVDADKGEIVPFDGGLKITSQCIRVPVLNGHTATVFLNFGKKATKEELVDRLVNYTSKRPSWGCRTRRSTSSNTSPRMTVRRSSSMWTTRAAWACQSAVCARIRSLTGSSWGWLTTRCAVPPAVRSNAPKCSRRSVISARSDGSLPLRLKLRLETIKRPG